jgi:ABC-type uncharacterized transport system permease subunit
MTFIALACIALYVAAAWQLGVRLLGATQHQQQLPSVAMMGLGLVALCLHGATLYETTLGPDGLRLGVFNVLSMVGWVVTALVLFALRGRPLDNLGLFVLPLTALSVLLAWLLPSPASMSPSLGIGLQVHIGVSVLGYGLLALAALQAALVALQDHFLREKRWMGALRALPPLTRQEELLFQLIGAGFFFLSLSLASGAMYVTDLFGQHLVHKTVLSGLAWCVFGVVLFGRWRFGWRGRTVIRWCLAAFVLLMLGYFGAKLVLEEILGRSWSN